jgi:monofunctional glycosyltransferase
MIKRALIIIALLVLAALTYLAFGLPSRAAVRALAEHNPGTTGVMRQREEEARRAGRPVRRVQHWVPLARVSKHLVHAVLASEDQKFFGHEGVDWEAVQKSLEEDRKRGRFARGGSTITQQLAKNLFFTTHKSLARKARELVVAFWLEQELTKARILELYLNVIEWGDGVYGCQAAALRYYGKPAADLRPDEAAGLAAMIPSPRRLNPLVSPARHARATRRVLWLMANAGFLSRSGLGAEPPPEPVEEDDETFPPPREVSPPERALTLPPSTTAPEASPLPEVSPSPTPPTDPSPGTAPPAH